MDDDVKPVEKQPEDIKDVIEQVVIEAEKNALEPLTEAEKESIREQVRQEIILQAREKGFRIVQKPSKPSGWAKKRKHKRKLAKQARRANRGRK